METQHFPHVEDVACPHAMLSKTDTQKLSAQLDPLLSFLRLQNVNTESFTIQFLLDHPSIMDQSQDFVKFSRDLRMLLLQFCILCLDMPVQYFVFFNFLF